LHNIVFAVYVAVKLYFTYLRDFFTTYRNLLIQLDSIRYGFTFSLKENTLTCIFQLSQGL